MNTPNPIFTWKGINYNGANLLQQLNDTTRELEILRRDGQIFVLDGVRYNGLNLANFALKLQEEVRQLREWIHEFSEVESEWSPQEVGELIGLQPGERIRPAIANAIRKLQADMVWWKQIADDESKFSGILEGILARIATVLKFEGDSNQLPTEVGSLKIELVISDAIKNYLAVALEKSRAEAQTLAKKVAKHQPKKFKRHKKA